eukprot:TRINITY_DN6860_c0_g1_i11.p1 TRINITY_DN6860_c0_g1~~TRINITY_DN6860_c0_g1_i11.p1  ORF type:complete len:214 (+),score=28.09 TRINITY_DN6860_c0_g1_i11:407-1048(+)
MAVNTGCSLPPQVGLAITIAVLAPKALSSGLFDYVITKSETGYTKAEMKREIWEYENYPDGEKKEMVDIYVSKGLSKKDASDLVELLCRNENIFIGTMMAEELGLLPPTDQSPVPYSTCHSVGFLCCGLIPIMTYIFAAALGFCEINVDVIFGVSCLLASITIFSLGCLASRWSDCAWWKYGFMMWGNAFLTVFSSYLLGWLMSYLLALDQTA